MTEQTEAPTSVSGESDASDSDKKYERSRIKFPYSDIDDAVAVAEKIKQNFGNRCSLAQLGAAFDQSLKSGAFRTKIASAGTFGAIATTRGNVELTPLGHRLADLPTRDAAKVEAFLAVPLYAKVYKEFEGKSLPGDAGLETCIKSYGVVDNQVDRARQVLQRSAEKAGFFWGGRSRLVMPPSGTLPPEGQAGDNPADPIRDEGGDGGDGERMATSNPLLVALLNRMLPAEGKQFSARERKRFFRALAVNLDVIYGEPTDGALDAEKLADLFTVDAPPARGAVDSAPATDHVSRSVAVSRSVTDSARAVDQVTA